VKNNNSKHKNLSQTTEHQNQTYNTQDDSSQVCYIRASGVRKHTSFRCDSGLWDAFKKLCLANGLSTCEILERLILGVCVGLSAKTERVAQPTTINVYAEIPKFVKRVRRARVEYVDEREERFFCGLRNDFVEADGLPLSDCFGCPNGSCRSFLLRKGVEGVE
jgi:hypothetical protein